MADHKTDPKFVRESMTWRRMKPWQIGGILVAVVLFVIIALMVL